MGEQGIPMGRAEARGQLVHELAASANGGKVWSGLNMMGKIEAGEPAGPNRSPWSG